MPPAVDQGAGVDREHRRARRLIRSWIGTARGENGKTRVTFVWEPLPPVAGMSRFQPSQVSLSATGASGQVYFRGRVPKDEPTIVSDRPVDGQGNLGAPRGAAPRAVARDFDVATRAGCSCASPCSAGARTSLDTEMREVKVPDFTAPQVQVQHAGRLSSAGTRASSRR